MATVDPGFAAYLQATARFVTTVVSANRAAYGDKAIATTITSPLALQGDAQAEANRQALFLAGPIARDSHVVRGRRRDLVGKVITIIGDRLGYESGDQVFVVSANESNDGGVTVLGVLKRL